MRNTESISNRDTKRPGEEAPPGDREEEIMITTVAATAEGKPFAQWTSMETAYWYIGTFMAEWTDQYYGRYVNAPDAFLRFARYSCDFPVYEGETEESAAERLAYSPQTISENIGTMLDFLGTVFPALKYFDANRIAAFDSIIWKSFELEGEEVLRNYMESDYEEPVTRDDLDEWWLNEMLHDKPGFLAAIQKTAANVDPHDLNFWWEYHR
jgi:hypothetical protein